MCNKWDAYIILFKAEDDKAGGNKDKWKNAVTATKTAKTAYDEATARVAAFGDANAVEATVTLNEKDAKSE